MNVELKLKVGKNMTAIALYCRKKRNSTVWILRKTKRDFTFPSKNGDKVGVVVRKQSEDKQNQIHLFSEG